MQRVFRPGVGAGSPVSSPCAEVSSFCGHRGAGCFSRRYIRNHRRVISQRDHHIDDDVILDFCSQPAVRVCGLAVSFLVLEINKGSKESWKQVKNSIFRETVGRCTLGSWCVLKARGRQLRVGGTTQEEASLCAGCTRPRAGPGDTGRHAPCAERPHGQPAAWCQAPR